MKILILRFSSIGDIVLTTPIVRCIKNQIKGAEVHYSTKKEYHTLISNNPYIDKSHLLNGSLKELIKTLKAEQFDCIIDLHKNLRTLKIKKGLGIKSTAFPKVNWQKWLMVNTHLNYLPNVHIVDRYFEAVKHLEVINDQKGLDFNIPQTSEVDVNTEFKTSDYISVAVGAKFATKQVPVEKLAEILEPIEKTIVLLGGKEDFKKGEELSSLLTHKNVYNTCGAYNLLSSGSIVQQSSLLITADTGLMHIASAFNTPIVSIWGNTVPDFGMYPYKPLNPDSFSIHQVEGLKCRPCSKIGFAKCPKKHFKCMLNQDTLLIQESVLKYLNKKI
jgi:ADP-heptose:LPS heptosyltransferase